MTATPRHLQRLQPAAPASSPWGAMVQRLVAVPAAAPVLRFNPRPAGVIRHGSATAIVLQFLRARPLLWTGHHAIVTGTNCTEKAIDWALIYLRRLELIRLQLTDLWVERGAVLVRGGKGGRDRAVPVAERALV